MPATRECDFCGDDIEPGTGTMFVAVNGAVTHFCSSKCEKNADLGRESRDHQWTAAGQAVAPDAHGPGTDVDEPAPDKEPEGATEKSTAVPDLESIEENADETVEQAEVVDELGDAVDESEPEGNDGGAESVEAEVEGAGVEPADAPDEAEDDEE